MSAFIGLFAHLERYIAPMAPMCPNFLTCRTWWVISVISGIDPLFTLFARFSVIRHDMCDMVHFSPLCPVLYAYYVQYGHITTYPDTSGYSLNSREFPPISDLSTIYVSKYEFSCFSVFFGYFGHFPPCPGPSRYVRFCPLMSILYHGLSRLS